MNSKSCLKHYQKGQPAHFSLSQKQTYSFKFFYEYPENSIDSMGIATKDIKRCPILLIIEIRQSK